MKINQIKGLNRQARKFLLEHCVSKRNAEVMAFWFNGYINGQEVEDETLIRESGKWYTFRNRIPIQSIYGEVEGFNLTRNTIL